MEDEIKLIEKKHQVTTFLLDQVSLFFDKLNFENFDVLFPIIDKTMIQYHLLKEELVAEYGAEKLNPFLEKETEKAKLVEKKFDNTVAMYSEELQRLKQELAANMSKKKLTAYKR